MNKNVNAFKKFKFFDEEKFGQKQINQAEKPIILKQSVFDYTLSDIIPIEMKVINKLVYICGQISNSKNPEIKGKFRLIKIQGPKIIDEYILFNDSIINFDIKISGGNTYLVALGTDLKNPEKDKSESKIVIEEENQLSSSKEKFSIKVIPTEKSIPSIKIFEFNEQISKTNSELNGALFDSDNSNNKDRITFLENMLKLKNSFYLMKNKDNLYYTGTTLSGIDDTYEPIDKITLFSVSPLLNSVVASVYNNSVIQIRCEKDNLSTVKEPKFSLMKSPDDSDITNLVHSRDYIYFTTKDNVFFKNISENKIQSLGAESEQHIGVTGKNFCLGEEPGQFIISTSSDYYLEEYLNNIDKGRSWFFDKPKNFTQYFKSYILFVRYEDNISAICVYDPKNQIFICYQNSMDKIYSVASDEEKIYILSEDSTNVKKITYLKEKDNKAKFDIFYKSKFFDTAAKYAGFLGYDKKKLSEISKLHAEHLYSKNDFEKSVAQYINTINYLDPSYVIQKFLDGSKLNYLIRYLEELQKNKQFKASCAPERLKDFTALLLNCYIKQKQIDKLKEFVESKNIDDKVSIRTAIEVCKDTNKIDLALSIAQKAKMVDSYVQILMEIKNDYAESLDFLKELKDVIQKFNLLLKYGEKFLAGSAEDAMKVITSLIEDIIDIKNDKKDDPKKEEIKELKYEKIIHIFISKESEPKLESLLDRIMKIDNNCPQQIIIRRIELLLDRYSEKKDMSLIEEIKNILHDKRFEDKLDKNYLLMLFKISGCEQGIAELSNIMELDQDLLNYYMDKHEYEKLNSACLQIMGKSNNKVNYYLQALNYYISNSRSDSTGEYIGQYIKVILDKLSLMDNFTPMIILDIASKNQGHVLEFGVIKKYILDWIKVKKEELREDKEITEINNTKLEQNAQQLKELQSKAKTYTMPKCPLCGRPLELPFVYFACGHGFDQSCLNGESYEEVECSECKKKNSVLTKRIIDGKSIANDHDSFYGDLMNNTKKFDFHSKYFGKGIFINKNDKENDNLPNEKNELGSGIYGLDSNEF